MKKLEAPPVLPKHLMTAGALWCLTYISASIAIGVLSVALLSWQTLGYIRNAPPDWMGATALGIATLAFVASFFLPLWGHKGFSYNKEGEQVWTRHLHSIAEMGHIH